MRSRNIQKKTNDRPLKRVVGLIFAAIALASLLLVGLVFRRQAFGGLPYVPPPETGTLLSLAPTSIAQLPVSLTAELSAVATSNSSVPVIEFDPSAASQVSPADVLNEVTVFAGAGGPEDNRCFQEPAPEQPMFGTPPQQVEWLSPVFLISCGWQRDEFVVLTVSHDGSIYATENLQSLAGMVSYTLPISSSMTDGDYTIAIESSRSRIETTVHVFVPSSPRVYPVNDEGLVLYGFAPNEAVRLFAYKLQDGPHKMKLAAWSSYQVDGSGRLIIQAAPKLFIYFVVGDQAGLVGAGSLSLNGLARSILVAPCAGGRPSYLEQEHNALAESDTDLRSAPGESYASLVTLAAGTLVSVVDGPTCVEDSAWWYIEAGNGLSGWMPEYQDDVYLLSPYPKDTLAKVAQGLPELEFDPAAASQVPPEDVFDQVNFFGKGAGFCDRPPYPTPTITEEPRDEELFTKSILSSCGWEQGETLKGTVQYPDGRMLIKYVQAQGANDSVSGDLGFMPTLEDPPGTYIFTLAGRKGSVSATVEFHTPEGARLYVMDPDRILLYHFAPQESVRLICYGTNAKLLAWQDITVDPSGNQPVRVESGDCTFVAIGKSSGEVHQVRDVTGTIQKSCGGLTSRLKDLSKARVASIDGTGKPLRDVPGISQDVKASLPEGTNLMVAGLPQCVDGVLWWFVYVEDYRIGWMPEEQNGVYLLEPLPQ